MPKEPITKKCIWLLSVGKNALVVVFCAVLAFVLDIYGQKPFSLTGECHHQTKSVALLQTEENPTRIIRRIALNTYFYNYCIFISFQVKYQVDFQK